MLLPWSKKWYMATCIPPLFRTPFIEWVHNSILMGVSPIWLYIFAYMCIYIYTYTYTYIYICVCVCHQTFDHGYHMYTCMYHVI